MNDGSRSGWRRVAASSVGLLIVVLGACGDSSVDFEPVPPDEMVDSGSWYSRETWPHDGNPVTYGDFVVYSDAAAPDARLAMAEIADELWLDLLPRFEVDEGDLIYPPDRENIDIYVYKDRFPQQWGMRAYQAGLIAWSLDHDQRQTDDEHYLPVVEHELVHVLETLLKGRDSTIEPMVDTWFSEGLAEAVAGGTSGGPIRGHDQLSDLLASHNGQNPIALKRDTHYVPDNTFHYPMFQLAVEYLLDERGGGRTLADARDLFIDMAEGATFEEAFGAHMGVPLDTYEAEFFTRIDEYLPAHRNLLFTPLGIAILAVAIVGTTATVLIASGTRHRNREAGALARIGFSTSTTLGAVVAAGVTLGVLVILNTAGNLYNESETPGRHLASWLIVGYFAGSLAILLWTQRRWATRATRLAYLGLPLVLLLLGATIAVAGVLL